MERVLGKTVKAMLKGLQSISDCPEQLATQIGKALALMHDADIVHGSQSKLHFFSMLSKKYIYSRRSYDIKYDDPI
jgi:tRNA A-37 threonylcarbamoyl transferase component Bud32